MGARIMLTEAEFLALPDSPGKQELIDGELIELPPSTDSHDELARRIAALLQTVVDPVRVWIETAYHLPQQYVRPDVSVSWPDQRVDNDFKQGSPMLAVEVASPGQATDLDRKGVLYLQHGAAEAWVIDPRTRTMKVFGKGVCFSVSADDDYYCELLGLTITPEYRTPTR